MSVLDAFLRSWPLSPFLVVSLISTAIIYARGFASLYRRATHCRPGKQAVYFFLGLIVLYLALASPLEDFSGLLLQVHMIQHMLLLMVVPPLIWLGDPLLPILRGVPLPVRRYWIVPVLQCTFLRRFFETVARPGTALTVFSIVLWMGHTSFVYERVLSSPIWHYFQHGSFLVAGLLFWYPVTQAFVSRSGHIPWIVFPCLLVADLQNTILSAIFTFSDHVLYAHYDNIPRIAGISALADQANAGVFMWIPGSIAFLLPFFLLGLRALHGQRKQSLWTNPSTQKIEREFFRRKPLEVIGVPSSSGFPSFSPVRQSLVARSVYGILKNRFCLLFLQLIALLLALMVIWDGLTGPKVAAMNLAGVLPWIHWRGLVVFGLLFAGNLACMACPLMLVRTAILRCLSITPIPLNRFRWPRLLRGKWFSAGLFVLFLWAYEAFALWDKPALTASMAIGFFFGAVVIDGLFKGASFCKYVCPIGQFNFVSSLISPFDLRSRQSAICQLCASKDCLRGNASHSGCQLHLFMPRKEGGMDCTGCLACVRACPHDNIAVRSIMPASTLWHDRVRSGVGRLSRRTDMAALIHVFIFGAFVNALGMIAPIREILNRLSQAVGLSSNVILTTLLFIAGLIAIPMAVTCMIAWTSHKLGSNTASWIATWTRYFYCLIPLGFSMWLAHYAFHFLTGYESLLPVFQRFIYDQGWISGTNPQWIAGCCRPAAGWLLKLEILALDCGYLLSLYTGYRIASDYGERLDTGMSAFIPWVLLLTALFALGIWILFQPMEMRGLMP